MTRIFNAIFTWSNFWALARGLAVITLAYMIGCFLWPILTRGAHTAHYAIFVAPGNAGNGLSDKLGLKSSGITKPAAPTPTFGGPTEELSSVEHARLHRERKLKAEELLLESDIEQVSADAAATREAGIRQLMSKRAQPGDCLQVGVLDRKTGKALAVDSDLYVETSQTTLVETVRAGLGKELPALRGVTYHLYARIPGGTTSTRSEIHYKVSDYGPKTVILWVDN